ncbi:hypothetical protein ACHAXS_007885 [Conticribra weissflogii]
MSSSTSASQLYFFASVFLAFLAVVTSPSDYLWKGVLTESSLTTGSGEAVERIEPLPEFSYSSTHLGDPRHLVADASNEITASTPSSKSKLVYFTSTSLTTATSRVEGASGNDEYSKQKQQSKQQSRQTRHNYESDVEEVVLDGVGNVIVSQPSASGWPSRSTTSRSTVVTAAFEETSSASSSNEKSYWFEDWVKDVWGGFWKDASNSDYGDILQNDNSNKNNKANHDRKVTSLGLKLFSSLHQGQKNPQQKQQISTQQTTNAYSGRHVEGEADNGVWSKWLQSPFTVSKETSDGENEKNETNNSNGKPGKIFQLSRTVNSMTSFLSRVIDPSLSRPIFSEKRIPVEDNISMPGTQDNLDPTSFTPSQSPSSNNNTTESSFTDIVDKILTSTPRLLAIANLLLTLTYLLHTAVADVFLGTVQTTSHTVAGSRGDGREGTAATAVNDNNNNNTDNNTNNNPNRFLEDQTRRQRRLGRERLGGFLLFKLLLVAAVIEPDTLDLLILLSWYTLLSFLRSLGSLAGSSIHAATQSGQNPPLGAFRLLIAVLACDLSALGCCVVLFHMAGWNMLFLLNCDCVLMGVDVLTHMAKYSGAMVEENHRLMMAELEEMQVELNARGIERRGSGDGNVVNEESASAEDDGENPSEEDFHRVEREIEAKEADYSSRMATLDSTIFALEVFALALTACHFGHIWMLHGASFGLVDAILAMHINSTLSALFRKVCCSYILCGYLISFRNLPSTFEFFYIASLSAY